MLKKILDVYYLHVHFEASDRLEKQSKYIDSLNRKMEKRGLSSSSYNPVVYNVLDFVFVGLRAFICLGIIFTFFGFNPPTAEFSEVLEVYPETFKYIFTFVLVLMLGFSFTSKNPY